MTDQDLHPGDRFTGLTGANGAGTRTILSRRISTRAIASPWISTSGMRGRSGSAGSSVTSNRAPRRDRGDQEKAVGP